MCNIPFRKSAIIVDDDKKEQIQHLMEGFNLHVSDTGRLRCQIKYNEILTWKSVPHLLFPEIKKHGITYRNGNYFDLRRANLTWACSTTNKSEYFGVQSNKAKSKWSCTILKEGRRVVYKHFDSEREAALYYNEKIRGIHPSRPLNVIKEDVR